MHILSKFLSCEEIVYTTSYDMWFVEHLYMLVEVMDEDTRCQMIRSSPNMPHMDSVNYTRVCLQYILQREGSSRATSFGSASDSV